MDLLDELNYSELASEMREEVYAIRDAMRRVHHDRLHMLVSVAMTRKDDGGKSEALVRALTALRRHHSDLIGKELAFQHDIEDMLVAVHVVGTS